jgi:hypothetical protein
MEVGPGDTVLLSIELVVEPGISSGNVTDLASVTGSGASEATTSVQTNVNSSPPPPEVRDFNFQALSVDGQTDTQAGDHPYELRAGLDFSTKTEQEEYVPVGDAKDVIVDLPLGLVGDPRATPTCPLNAVIAGTGTTACPIASRVGTVLFEAAPGSFRFSMNSGSQTSDVYNVKPEAGYPAEFAFNYVGKPIFMYANLVRAGAEYRLQITVPGLPEVAADGVQLAFFGNPAEHNIGDALPPAFLTNPVDCSTEPLSANVRADSWEHPNVWSERSAAVYPRITNCNMLQFQPSLLVRPDTTQADEPSGYTFEIEVTQFESLVTPSTPELRNATITLPPGVSLSPSAADGLRACPAQGPGGIDIEGSGATEVGEGSSPYADGMEHTAPGHCPSASIVGSVEVATPLLASPLEGHLFLAEPRCGGSGQTPCTDADATNGNLFGLYLEAAGSGAIVKLAGRASVNPATGQVTATFENAPQLPFSKLTVHMRGGVRAPLANPQTCGPAMTSSDLVPWSAPITPDGSASTSFDVDWDGAGGACPASLPFAPSLTAGTVSPAAGAFSPFTLTLTRTDREQYLSRLSVTTPPGLLGMLSSVTLCSEALASQGACPAASEIGTTTVAAGAGSHPYWVTGHVYLTESYRGAPFGLSIIVPAKAGPFNLGNVNVRATINVDPTTSALTILSDPLPQIIDGVSLRVQTVNVEVNRPNFIFNPTNCEAHQITANVAGSQGATAQVSSPFAAANCKSLPFDPRFTVASQAKTSKADGASLDVKVAYTNGQANIRSVAVTLPMQLPARLTTIQKACLAATFEANPAACPAASLIGIARARTPVLPVLLSGPAYLVSHGGAAFPDVVLILQGDGVRVDLTGNVNIVKDITSSTFASVPDAPIASFELNLPEGPHSALAATLPASAKGSLCNAKLTMPTTLTAQNGLQLKQSTKIAVSGCSKPKPKKKPKARRASHRYS